MCVSSLGKSSISIKIFKLLQSGVVTIKNSLLMNTVFEQWVTEIKKYKSLDNSVENTICHRSKHRLNCTDVYVDPINFSYNLDILTGPYFGDYAWTIEKESNFQN